jgi:radical SAM protein with 4Fe4S-binding SPASM domain
VKDIKIPKLSKSVVLGMSYVYQNDSNDETLDRLQIKLKEYDVAYVRIIPDCGLPIQEFGIIQEQIKQIVIRRGTPFSYQDKYPTQANCCYLGAIHPMLYADGYVYACDSHMHNFQYMKRYWKEYRLCHWSEIKSYFSQQLKNSMVNSNKCSHCFFVENNDLIAQIISPIEHIDFL